VPTTVSQEYQKVTEPLADFPFDRLYFDCGEGERHQLYWARFFIELGLTLSTFTDKEQYFIVALAIPSRCYASSLLAAGINYGRSTISREEVDQNYIDFITSLEINTPVTYWKGNAKKKALFDGIKQLDGKKYFGLKDEKDGISYIEISKARQITLDMRENIRLPAHQSGRRLPPPSQLVKVLYAEKTLKIISESKLESVIIGYFNSLKRESEFPLAILDENKGYCSGQLNDLIRLHSSQLSYRSYIWPVNARIKLKLPGNDTPFAVIYDGAQAFIKWKEHFCYTNRVIILDKVDRNFKYAADLVNCELFPYRSDKSIKINIPLIPSGIEMMLFGVNR
jgi:hypothetical protein